MADTKQDDIDSLFSPASERSEEKRTSPSEVKAAPVEGKAAPDTAHSEPAKVPRTPSREVPVSTIVHLMGLASQADFSMLDNKLDMLNSKITAMQLKIDRLASQLSSQTQETYIERLDFQIADIRSMMRKVVPTLLSTTENMAKEAVERRTAPASKPPAEKPAKKEEPSRTDAAKPAAESASESEMLK